MCVAWELTSRHFFLCTQTVKCIYYCRGDLLDFLSYLVSNTPTVSHISVISCLLIHLLNPCKNNQICLHYRVKNNAWGRRDRIMKSETDRIWPTEYKHNWLIRSSKQESDKPEYLSEIHQPLCNHSQSKYLKRNAFRQHIVDWR